MGELTGEKPATRQTWASPHVDEAQQSLPLSPQISHVHPSASSVYVSGGEGEGGSGRGGGGGGVEGGGVEGESAPVQMPANAQGLPSLGFAISMH